MGKTLTQIAFEFSSEAAIKKAYTPPRPPSQETEFTSQNKRSNSEEEVKVVEARPAPPRKSTRGRKSLKDIALEAELTDIPADEELFKKQYYAIGEVAEMFRVNQSLLRYWENEFDILQPRKNRKGDRFFRPVDIKNLQLIHDLLRRRKFTIEGAKDYLKRNKKAEEKFALIESLQKIKAFLNELKASL
jgi:DNA-binding transcriptional MerR regulator